MYHLKNVILLVIQKRWNITDKIKITSGITTYYFENNILYDNYSNELESSNNCECLWDNCPVCSQTMKK